MSLRFRSKVFESLIFLRNSRTSSQSPYIKTKSLSVLIYMSNITFFDKYKSRRFTCVSASLEFNPFHSGLNSMKYDYDSTLTLNKMLILCTLKRKLKRVFCKL